MQFYTNFNVISTGLLANLRKFWAHLTARKRKTRSVPISPDIGPGGSIVFELYEKIGEFEPFYLKNTGTNGESTHFLPPPARDKIESKAPDPAPEPDSQTEKPLPVSQNRAQRRATRAREAQWEKQRKKLDKWVTPQGQAPIKVERGPRTKPDPADPAVGTKLEDLGMLDGKGVEDANFVLMDGEVGYKESEFYGEFSFRDTILDQLERYWVYLERMKRNDPDAYQTYKRLGATVIPPVHWFLHAGYKHKKEILPQREPRREVPALTPWWKVHRPGFGCVTFGITSQIEQEELDWSPDGNPKTKMWVPKFLYFSKYKIPPPNVQPTSGGDVYGMTVWWDRPHDPDPKVRDKHKGGVPEQYSVFISADGNDVHVLPICETEYLKIRRRKNSRGYKRGKLFDIPHRVWHIPGRYTAWAKHHNTTPNILLSSIFVDAATAMEESHYSMVRVAVHNKDLTAVFGVDVKRLPYFFKDRDISLTEKGSRKRAFHMVRGHFRRDGTVVSWHFRGERDFTWAGYSVNITIPARDHFMLTDYDVGASDMLSIPREERGKYISERKMAEKLAAGIEKGVGGTHPKRKP
jgi:hypothetical protein